MGNRFKENVFITRSFFFVRFAFSVLVGFIYILLAAFIQYNFVKLLGESTFNYIVCGLLSLLLGAIVCNYLGSLLFMFVKGWHVSALAKIGGIKRNHLSAFDVGIRAFNKNFTSFGIVYGVRLLMKSVFKKFKYQVWKYLDEVPYSETLRKFAEHPVVEYLANDVLHYAFDAVIYYIVRFPPEDLDDVPQTVLSALKKYLMSLSSILISSVQTYLLFRLLPKVLKWLLIFSVLFTKGLVAGILINVLMWPVFYILDNALFDPLTMVVFISAYSKHCKEDVDENSPIIKAVNRLLSGDDSEADSEVEAESEDNSVGTTIEDLQDDKEPTTDDSIVSIEIEDLETQPPEDPVKKPEVKSSKDKKVESKSSSLEKSEQEEKSTEEDQDKTPKSLRDLIATPPQEVRVKKPQEDLTQHIAKKPVESSKEFHNIFTDINVDSLDESTDEDDDSGDRAQNFLIGDD